MVKCFRKGFPSGQTKFYGRWTLLQGRWLFLAYLQGIETFEKDEKEKKEKEFLAYLQGIETEVQSFSVREVLRVSSLPTRV